MIPVPTRRLLETRKERVDLKYRPVRELHLLNDQSSIIKIYGNCYEVSQKELDKALKEATLNYAKFQ